MPDKDPFTNAYLGFEEVRRVVDSRWEKIACYITAVVIVSIWLFSRFKGWELDFPDAIILGIAASLVVIPRFVMIQLSKEFLKFTTNEEK